MTKYNETATEQRERVKTAMKLKTKQSERLPVQQIQNLLMN